MGDWRIENWRLEIARLEIARLVKARCWVQGFVLVMASFA